MYDSKEIIIQQRYHQKLFLVLIPALEDPEPRYILYVLPRPCFILTFLKSTCACCRRSYQLRESVERDTLLLYLDLIVERLLKLLKKPPLVILLWYNATYRNRQ